MEFIVGFMFGVFGGFLFGNAYVIVGLALGAPLDLAPLPDILWFSSSIGATEGLLLACVYAGCKHSYAARACAAITNAGHLFSKCVSLAGFGFICGATIGVCLAYLVGAFATIRAGGDAATMPDAFASALRTYALGLGTICMTIGAAALPVAIVFGHTRRAVRGRLQTETT